MKPKIFEEIENRFKDVELLIGTNKGQVEGMMAVNLAQQESIKGQIKEVEGQMSLLQDAITLKDRMIFDISRKCDDTTQACNTNTTDFLKKLTVLEDSLYSSIEKQEIVIENFKC